MSRLVPTVATPVSAAEMAEALRVAWIDQFGSTPSRESLLVLLAQWSLETGGGARMMNWNIGNAKARPGLGDWTEFATTEVLPGGQVEHLVARFRAFSSLATGAAFYLVMLANRFKEAWPFVLAGDAAGFAAKLHDLHYYTAPVEAYVAGTKARLAQVEKAWPDSPVVAADDQPIFINPEPGT